MSHSPSSASSVSSYSKGYAKLPHSGSQVSLHSYLENASASAKPFDDDDQQSLLRDAERVNQNAVREKELFEKKPYKSSAISHGHGSEIIMEGRLRNTSPTQTFINLIKSYIASGILGLPYAFSQSGMLSSIFLVVVLMSISIHCMYTLVECKYRLDGAVTFGDVAHKTFGPWMSRLVDFLVVFTQFGFATVYIVYVSANLQDYWGIDNAQIYLIIILFPIFVAMSWIRTLRWIGPVSAFANVCLVAGVTIILIFGFAQISHRYVDGTEDYEKYITLSGLPQTFGMVVYSIEGIGCVLPSETAITEPKKFPRILVSSLVVAGLSYLFFGVILYDAFGNLTSDQLISCNIDQQFVPQAGHGWVAGEHISRVLLIMAIFLSFPMQLFVAIDLMEEAIFKPGRLNTNNFKLKQNIFRTLIVFVGAFIAATVPKFNLLISLIGNFGGASLQFVLPSLFFLKLYPDASKKRKALSVLYIFVGLVGGIYGTYDTIHKLVDSFSEPSGNSTCS